MPSSHFSARGLSVALLIVSMALAANAQNTATLKQQAESGDANAELALGLAYSMAGEGVPHNDAQAAIWVRKAADQGLVDAQVKLGIFYAEGWGVPQDYAQAAVWWRKAAEQGDADSQGRLADEYMKGRGVPQDYSEAYFWLDLAASGKSEAVAFTTEELAKERDDAASHLTSTVLLQTQERARKWFQAHSSKVDQ